MYKDQITTQVLYTHTRLLIKFQHLRTDNVRNSIINLFYQSFMLFLIQLRPNTISKPHYVYHSGNNIINIKDGYQSKQAYYTSFRKPFLRWV
jgi:hypothetical protein